LIKKIQNLNEKDILDNDAITMILYEGREKYELPVDFLHFIGLCGLFPPSRNILKNFSKNEETFINLVKNEGKIAKDHFLQSVILYFVRQYKGELDKFGPTFMKKLVDENLIGEKFLLSWYDKEIRLDKNSFLYDKKAEKSFREIIEKYVEWLKDQSSGSSGSSSSDDEEENKEAEKPESAEEEQETEAKVETEAQKKQRELIEKQRKAQAAAFE